jgi:hypothetical protein
MAVARAHGIPIDSAGLDLGAPSPVDRVVKANDHRPKTRKPVNQHHEQEPGACQGAALIARARKSGRWKIVHPHGDTAQAMITADLRDLLWYGTVHRGETVLLAKPFTPNLPKRHIVLSAR